MVTAKIFVNNGAGFTAFDPATSDAVVLGTDVKVEVIGPDLDGFYIKQCKAVNNNNVNPTNEITLIRDGCEVPDTGVLADIEPDMLTVTCADNLCTAAIEFRQFGFVKDGTTLDDPELEFSLVFTVGFGDAPTCTGGTARSLPSSPDEKPSALSLPLKCGANSHIENGVATDKKTPREEVKKPLAANRVDADSSSLVITTSLFTLLISLIVA